MTHLKNTLSEQNEEHTQENRKCSQNHKIESLKHTWMVQDEANELNQKKKTIYHHCNL